MTSSALNNHARITTHNQPFDLRQACTFLIILIYNRNLPEARANNMMLRQAKHQQGLHETNTKNHGFNQKEHQAHQHLPKRRSKC